MMVMLDVKKEYNSVRAERNAEDGDVEEEEEEEQRWREMFCCVDNVTWIVDLTAWQIIVPPSKISECQDNSPCFVHNTTG